PHRRPHPRRRARPPQAANRRRGGPPSQPQHPQPRPRRAARRRGRRRRRRAAGAGRGVPAVLRRPFGRAARGHPLGRPLRAARRGVRAPGADGQRPRRPRQRDGHRPARRRSARAAGRAPRPAQRLERPAAAGPARHAGIRPVGLSAVFWSAGASRPRRPSPSLAVPMSAFAQRAADLIGQTVDTYEIVEILGRGGMGVVYRAVDTSLDRGVALKMLHGHLVEDERFLLRFVAEANALGRLQHPNIVNVYALRHVEPYLFLVMEYVDGGSLHELLERRGALPWTEALPIMRQALRGIAYAHGQGILHRDVKPSNLLLSRYGEVKLADLGLARIQETADQLGLTRTGFTGGTLHYMPPEQLEGLRHVDARGDLYALGMTFYKMLA